MGWQGRLAVAAVVVLAMAIFVPTALAGGIAVSYPPDTKELEIPVGVVKSVNVCLYNNGDEDLLVVLEPENLEGMNVECPESFLLGAGTSREVTIKLSSNELGPFSGGVHIDFHTGAEPGTTGGTVVSGAFVPLAGGVYKNVYYSLTTTVEPWGTGSVDPSGGKYLAGTKVTLNAIPNPGYEFAFWSGSISGANPRIALTMNSNKQANAHFKENKGGSGQENETPPLELSVSLGVGSEPRPDRIFRQDETLTITARTNGEADISCVLKDPSGDRPVGMEREPECYVGRLELNDVLRHDYPFGGYQLIVTASRGDYEVEVPVTFQVLEAASGGSPWGSAAAAAIVVVLAAVFALFATRRRWLQRLKKRLKAPEAKKVKAGAIFFFLILLVALAPSVTAQEVSGKVSVNNVSPTVESISVDATLVDRDVDYEGSGATENVEILVRVRDNNGSADIAPLRLSIRDGNDLVVVDNVEVTENSVVDDLTLEFSYVFNPPDSLLDGALGKFDVRAEGWDESGAGVSDYTELGFELFTVDDLITTVSVDDPAPHRHQSITVSGSVSRVYGAASLDNAWVLDQAEGLLVAEVVGNTYSATYEVTSTLGATVGVHAHALDLGSGLDGNSSTSYTVVSSPALWVLLGLGTYDEEEAPADVDPSLQPGTYVGGEWVPREWFYPGETCFLRAHVRDANTDDPVTHARVEMTLVYGDMEFEVRQPESGLWEGSLLLVGIPADEHTIQVEIYAQGYTNWSDEVGFTLVEPTVPPPVEIPWWDRWWAWLGFGMGGMVAAVLLWRSK